MSTQNTNDGGPAFPVKPFSISATCWSDGSEGMSLRAYIATAALQGELAAQPAHSRDAETIAWRCCRFADALIAELKKQTE